MKKKILWGCEEEGEEYRIQKKKRGRPSKYQISEEMKENMIEEFLGGMTLYELGDYSGIPWYIVRRAICDDERYKKKTQGRGGRPLKYDVDNKTLEEMIGAFLSGATLEELVERYNIKYAGLRNILSKDERYRSPTDINALALQENIAQCDPLFLHYVIGLFDGEGHIGIEKYSKKCNIRTVIGMSDYEPIDQIYKTLGGRYSTYYFENPKRKPTMYRWATYGLGSYIFLQAIEPYLFAKREEAQIAIECYEQVIIEGNWNLSDPYEKYLKRYRKSHNNRDVSITRQSLYNELVAPYL